jgi:HSP20 family protein
VNAQVELKRGRLKFYSVGLAKDQPPNRGEKRMSNLTVWARPAWDVDRWVREFFGPSRDHVANGLFNGGFSPAAEIVKDGDDAVIRLELAGVDVDKDVNVELDRGRLVIHGERRDERAEQKDGRALREVRYGSFRRSFTLPAHVTSDAISASYDAGVLTVRVAGAYAGTQAKRIAVESK